MKFTGKRVIQKIVAVLIIMIMTLADFSIIGANVISYALDMVATNSNNVEFSAYFINDQEEKTTDIQSAINAKDLKMYVEVSVKNEGYFNGEITLGDSSFNFSDNISDDYVKEAKGNKVTLNQINAGTTAIIELKVNYANSEEVKKVSLNQENEINLTGTYVNSKKNVDIKGTTSVKVNWKSPKDAEAKLDTKILTNSVYKVNDVNKRIVQVLANSKLDNNSYPVKETNIEFNVPNGAEEVKVHSRSTYATNGEESKYEYNYDLNTDESKLTINLKNEEQDGKINWNKDVKDTLVVTYVYPENTTFNYEKINSNVTITTYDDTELKAESQSVISENIDGIVTSEIVEKEDAIYKGKIYTGEKRNYTSTTVLNIDYSEVVEEIELSESQAKFKTEAEEEKTNIQYVETKIEKTSFDKLFGQDGVITILDQDGTTIGTVNKDSQVDNDNIVIKYNDEVKAVTIKTSKPISNGILDIVHTKSILDSDLSREEVKDIIEIQEEVKSKFVKKDTNETTNTVTNTIKLKETSSDANITISKEKLSTITTNQNVEIVATLETNNESKDLYKNPTVKIVFPKEIQEVHISQAKALFRNGLEVKKTSQEKNNAGNIVLTVEFEGEQIKYDSEILNGLEIHFFANIVADKSIPSKDVKLKMQYTNENGIKNSYETETNIYLESQYGLMLYNKIENYNSKDEIIETIDESKEEGRLKVNSEDVIAKVTTSIINNYSTELNDIEIIGRLPSKDDENTFDSAISELSVNDDSAKIYYNKKVNAKTNDNNWTQDSKDAKSYKIVLNETKAGEVIKVTYDLDIEDELSYNVTGDLITDVTCSYGEKVITKSSNIVLATEEIITPDLEDGDKVETESKFELNITAVSGNRQLDNGDSIFDGETLRYTITIKNNTGKDYKGINIKAIQTNGKIFDLVETEVYNPVIYDGDGKAIENYWKVIDSNIKEFEKFDIDNGKTITIEYQVVVDKTQGDETYADISITSSDNTIKDNVTTDKYKIKDAELKLTFVPAVSEECEWTSESVQQSNLSITNVTEEELRNVEVKITLSKGLTCDKYDDYIDWSSDIEAEIKKKEINSLGQTVITLEIAQISSGKTAEIYVKPYILNFNGEKANVEFYAKATTTLNEVYSSNNIIREVIQVRKQIEVNQVAKINGNAITKDSVVNNGDTLEFHVTVKNSDKEDANLTISDSIQQGLNVKNITLVNNDNIKTDVTSKYNEQSFTYDFVLASGHEISIIISTIVDTTYMNGQNKLTNKINVSDKDTTAIYSSSLELDVNIEKIDDCKLNIEIVQESNISNNSIVKSGDKIEFIAIIKNTGDFDREVNIYDYINSSIEKIKVQIDSKDVTEKYLTNNDLEIENYTVKANTTNTIKVTGTIDLTNYTEKTISNEFIVKSSIADTKSNTIVYYTSQENKQQSSSEVQNYTIRGKAWIDSNKDGKRDDNEELVKDMVVKAINTETKEVLTTSATTKEDGSYELTLPQAKYIIIFMYNNENYYITTYQAEKVSEDINSDAVSKTLNIDNKDTTVGTTDIIDLSGNKDNIDIGLIFRNKFDLKLDKYISKIVITNNEGTTTHNFDNEELAKVEIASKYLSGSTVVVEYKIKVTNIGDIDGYVKNIVDYMPTDMTFSSDLNKDWYQSEKYLYNEELADKKLAPGESQEVTLVLTKTMTESNTGLVNNTAAIKSSYNEKSFSDVSTDNDNGLADIIVSVKTGAAIRLGLLTLSLTIVIAGIAYFITKKYISKKI